MLHKVLYSIDFILLKFLKTANFFFLFMFRKISTFFYVIAKESFHIQWTKKKKNECLWFKFLRLFCLFVVFKEQKPQNFRIRRHRKSKICTNLAAIYYFKTAVNQKLLKVDSSHSLRQLIIPFSPFMIFKMICNVT